MAKILDTILLHLVPHRLSMDSIFKFDTMLSVSGSVKYAVQLHACNVVDPNDIESIQQIHDVRYIFKECKVSKSVKYAIQLQ